MTARRHRPNKNPVRPDREMEFALEANRISMARSGLDPDNLPWVSRNGILYSTTNGQRLGKSISLGSAPEPYFDRWHHKRTGE